MPKGESIERFYLARLAEYRSMGYSDHAAARLAARDTKNKYGRLPKEGK